MRPSARRWLVVAALFAVTYGVSTPLASFGVFLPIFADTFGWSRGAISTALSINLLVGGIAGFGLGAIADRHGPRAVLVLTLVLSGVSFAMISTVDTLWQLYLFAGILGGLGMSTFYLLSAATVARWFDEWRALALALVLMGFSLGYISSGPLAAWLIEAVGWRAAYALIGAGSGLITVAAALTVRSPRAAELEALRRPAADVTASESAGGGSAASTRAHAGLDVAGVTLGQALRDPHLWSIAVAWFLLGGLTSMLSVHAVPFARDQGVSLAAASVALTAFGVGAVSGRILSGALSERVGATATLRTGYLMQLAALVALQWTPSRDALLVTLVVFGVGFTTTDTIITKVIPDVFGVRALGAIMGVLTLGWRCGAALAPAATGFLYDATGSYAIAFGAAPVAVVVSWALFALGTSRARRG